MQPQSLPLLHCHLTYSVLSLTALTLFRRSQHRLICFALYRYAIVCTWWNTVTPVTLQNVKEPSLTGGIDHLKHENCNRALVYTRRTIFTRIPKNYNSTLLSSLRVILRRQRQKSKESSGYTSTFQWCVYIWY